MKETILHPNPTIQTGLPSQTAADATPGADAPLGENTWSDGFKGITVTFDGGCEPNPGNMSYGICVFDGNRIVFSLRGTPGWGTNNCAELRGLVRALEVASVIKLAPQYAGRPLRIAGDSSYAIKAINQEQKLRQGAENKRLLTVAERVRDGLEPGWAGQLRTGTVGIPVVWIPREENADADKAAEAT